MRENTRSRILQAARTVFAEKGLGATISDIAEAAGVSQGLAYRYFPSKDAIYHALLRQLLQSGEVDKFSHDSGKSPRQLLEVFVSGTLRLRREHPEFYRFVFRALSDQSLPEDIQEMLTTQGQEVRRVLLRLVTDGQAAGEISKGDPDQLVDAVLACLEGLSVRLAYSTPRHTVHIPDAEIILRLLGPSPQRRKAQA